jgi:hypothetical protein
MWSFAASLLPDSESPQKLEPMYMLARSYATQALFTVHQELESWAMMCS